LLLIECGENGGSGRGGADDGAGHASLGAPLYVIAKNGADDPAGHDANDDRGRNRGSGGGADDGAGHA